MFLFNSHPPLKCTVKRYRSAVMALILVTPVLSVTKASEPAIKETRPVILDDPTKPPQLRTKAPVQKKRRLEFYHWNVASTLVSPSRRAAVINGQYVAEGNAYQQVRLLEVTPMYLTLEYEGKTYQLNLNKKRVLNETGDP